MDITKDTPISELYHSEDELMHWKYVKKERVNGKWKYYYDWDEFKNDAKTVINETMTKTSKSAIETANKASKSVNTYVSKAKNFINKWYNDPKNMYDVDSSTYKQKLDKIKETDEWKRIVARNDKEYVKTNADGTKTYLIDDYIVDKKHPVIDIMGDIMAGRDVTVNEITKDSIVAGLKDHAIGYLRTGMLAVGAISTFFNEKFKLQQGSYDDDIQALYQTADKGKQYLDATFDSYSTIASKNGEIKPEDITKLSGNAKISEQDIERLAKAVRAGQMAAEATRSINEGNVVQAARVIVDSDMLKSTLGSNEYYNLMANTLEGLSPEEIEAVNLLVRQLRK